MERDRLLFHLGVDFIHRPDIYMAKRFGRDWPFDRKNKGEFARRTVEEGVRWSLWIPIGAAAYPFVVGARFLGLQRYPVGGTELPLLRRDINIKG